MTRLEPLPPDLTSGAFSVGEARARGIPRSRLRASDLVTPFHGVRALDRPTSVAERCAAYRPRMREGEFFSHGTAAILFGMPVPLPLEGEPLHVAVREPQHPPQAAGVIGHRLGADTALRSLRGHAVAAPAHVWVQLAAALGKDELVVIGDFLVQRKRALCSMSELRDVVESTRGRGVRNLRRALAQVRPRTDSPQETRTRLCLVSAGLPEPVVGYTVRTADGGFVATPDLAYVREKIAIEYLGSDHWTKPDVFAEDIARREGLEQCGWLVIEVIARDLEYRRPLLVRRVSEALASRASR